MFKDIKNVMCSKRPNMDDTSMKASLMNTMTGQMISIKDDKECIMGRALDSTIIIEELFISRRHCSIKYENNRFIISDLHSSSGTFLNCERLPRNSNHFTELQHGDLIGFGERKMITIAYKFILHANPSKKLRLNKEHSVITEIHNSNEKYKNMISKLHVEIVNLKVELMILRNRSKTDFAEMQKSVKNVMDITSTQTLKAKDIIQQLTSKVSALMLKLNDDRKDQIASEEIKNQFYAQLENEFQCSICSDLVYKAATINCNHTFCEVCIRTWMGRNNINCPVCRASIQTVSQCLALDNYITKICDLMGGQIQVQRQLVLKERSLLAPVPSARRGRRRGGGNNSRRPTIQLPVDNFNFINAGSLYFRGPIFPEPVEVVDLTNITLR